MNEKIKLRSIAWEWLAALACYSTIIAPFGCQLSQLGGDGLDIGDIFNPPEGAGLFINDDFSDALLMAGTNGSGDAFFVYGTRQDNGNLEEVESVVVQTAAGQKSFITFESGRPTHAEGPDGSYVHVTYTEVSAARLKATVDFYNAQEDAVSSFPVEIDLQAALQTIAEQVQAVTGQRLDVTEVEDDGGSPKLRLNEQVRVTIFSPLFAAFILPLVALVAITQIILGQILLVIYALVAVTIQAVLLTALAPLFLMASLLQVSITRVELIGIGTIFPIIPPPPFIVLQV
ncbi:MAG: hypothetical protein HRF50_02585 [Phycisphaerae bacterium]|jgi:hypothetical protein